jgi:O-antigen/teichoic acid export membrane protein
MKLTKLTLQTLFFQIGGLISLFLGGMMSARILGPSGKGLLTLSMFYPSFFFVLGYLNIGLATIHYLGKEKYKKEEFCGTIIAIFFLILIILGLIFGSSYLFFKNIFYQKIPSYFLFLGMLVLPFNLALYFFSSFLQGLKKIFWYNLVNHGYKILVPFLIIFFWIITNTNYTPREGILVNIIAFFISSFFCFWLVLKLVPFPWRFNFSLFKDLIFSGAQLHIGTIGVFLFSRIDQLMIGNWLSTEKLGYYAVAVTLAEFLWLLSFAVQTILYPKLSYLSEKESQKIITQTCRTVFWLTVFGGIILAIFGKFAILIYAGKRFLPAFSPLLILIPGIVIHSVSNILGPLWVRKAWFFQLSGIALFVALLNIILNILFISQYGIQGAALASFISYLINFLIFITLYYFRIDKNIGSLFAFKFSDYSFLKNILKKIMILKRLLKIIKN